MSPDPSIVEIAVGLPWARSAHENAPRASSLGGMLSMNHLCSVTTSFYEPRHRANR